LVLSGGVAGRPVVRLASLAPPLDRPTLNASNMDQMQSIIYRLLTILTVKIITIFSFINTPSKRPLIITYLQDQTLSIRNYNDCICIGNHDDQRLSVEILYPLRIEIPSIGRSARFRHSWHGHRLASKVELARVRAPCPVPA
jgi:hypothetical protein